MQRDRQHIVAGVEDALRAVAVMQVDIEDGDPRRTRCADAARQSRNC